MTLKQSRLLEAIPTSSTLMEAGRKAGYSETARKIYTKGTKRLILNELNRLGYDKQSLLKRFDIGSAVALAKKDIASYHRGNENIARLQGLLTDNQTNIAVNNIDISFNIAPMPIQPIDIQPVKQDDKVT